MKKSLLFIAFALIIVACNNKTKQNDNQQTAAEVETYIGVDSLLNVVENLVGQTVKVKGYVTHTCSHSGKRCFIAGESQKATIRIESGGEIESFDASLVGTEIEVEGIVREQRYEKDKINEDEIKLEEAKASGEKSEEHCESEAQNIQQMRDWMEARGVDYYPTYYIDGEKYKIAE